MYISSQISTNFKYLRMKKVMILFMLMFTLSIFASGFDSDFEKKESPVYSLERFVGWNC